jgi:aspartate aminotransferase
MSAAVAAYQTKRDIAFDTLSRRFEVTKPQGAFYIFPKAPAGQSASAFVERAIAANVLIIPGNVFSEKDTHFRISYATTDERLRQGCEILNSLT